VLSVLAADDDLAVKALFAEARRRRRRIRLTAAVSIVALAAGAVTLSLAWPRPVPDRAGGRPPLASTGRAAGPPLLTWMDGNGNVILGNLTTFATRTVGRADADIASPLVAVSGHVYWVKQSGGYLDGAFWPRVVEELTLATGKSTAIAPGEFIFLSADGRRVYVSYSDIQLTELPATSDPPRQLPLPAGWYLPGGSSLAVANGFVVQSSDAPNPSNPADLAIWNPRTGRVKVLGRAEGAISAYTPRGAGYSLLAWMPASCRFPDCRITITNTGTTASRTLRSPLGYGFVLGGAFSPDGRELAVFVNNGPQPGGETAELAIVNTATGAVRLVPSVRMSVGEDADWVQWLPGGGRLIVQANRDYLVTVATLVVRPFRFTVAGGQDVNFSAVLLPASTHRAGRT
jgi:hypothetical protein